MSRRLAPLILVLVIAAAACSGAADTASEEDASAPAESMDGVEGEMAQDDATADYRSEESGLSGGASGSGAGRTASAPQAAPAPEQPDALPPTLPAATGDRIIKEGTIAVEVAEDGFDVAFSRVIDAAARAGGSVISSNTRSHEDGLTSGSVTVRVPVHAFEDLLVGLGRIGEIRSRQITAQDVSMEFVDLQSRQRHLEAQERFYLGLLDRAQTVGDAIAVQQHLDSIQNQMEQVKGRLAFLDERTSYSTLTVELFEAGAEPLLTKAETGRPSLAAAWDQARDAFLNVVGALLVAALFLAPLLPLALLAYLGWRAARRRPVVAPPAPATEATP